jgi:hypothetical protein
MRALEEDGEPGLPDPLPERPDAPPGYAEPLRRFHEAPEGTLTLADQRALVEQARALLELERPDRQDLIDIVDDLRKREEITVAVRSQLDEILARASGAGRDGAPEEAHLEKGRWKVRHLPAPGLDLWQLGKQVQAWYESQGSVATLHENSDGALVIKAHGRLRARMSGAGAAVTVVLVAHDDTLDVSVGGDHWGDKAVSAGAATALAAATGGVALPLLAPSILGATRQKTLPGKTLRYIEEALPLCRRA